MSVIAAFDSVLIPGMFEIIHVGSAEPQACFLIKPVHLSCVSVYVPGYFWLLGGLERGDLNGM